MEVKETMNETMEISLIFIEGTQKNRYQKIVLQLIRSFIDTSSCNVLPEDWPSLRGSASKGGMIGASGEQKRHG